MGKKIEVEIVGQAASFVRATREAAGAAGKLDGHFSRVRAAAGVAGLAIGGALVVALKDSVAAAEAGQVSQAALDTALQNTGQSLDKTKSALEAAEAASRKLGFADNDTRDSLARLEMVTGNTKAAISDLALAEDIARAKGVDLESATKIVTLTLAGSTKAAKQLGVAVVPVTKNMDALKAKYKKLGEAIPAAEAAQAKLLDKQATGAATIQALTDKVHGQAAAYADTAAGGMEQYHAQMEHLQQTMGAGLLPALTAIAMKLSSVATFLSQHKTVTMALVVGVGVLTVAMLALSVATTIAAAAEMAFLLPVIAVVAAIALLAAGLILAWQHSETFRAIVIGAFDAVKEAGEQIASFVTDTIPAAFQSVIDWLSSNWPIIATIIAGPFAPLVALATNAFGIRDKLLEAFDAILAFTATVWGEIKTVITTIWDATSAAVMGIVNALALALSTAWNGIKSALAAIVEATKTVIITTWEAIKTGVATVVDAIATVVSTEWNGIKTTVSTIVHAIETIVTATWGAIKITVTNEVNGLKTAVGLAWSAVKKIVADAVGPISTSVDAIVGVFQAVVDVLQAIIEAAQDAIGWLGKIHAPHISLPSIPHLASGGIVTRPTLALIGERGPEAVVPLSGGGSRMGGVTVNVYGAVGSPAEIARVIKNELVNIGRLNGGSALGGYA
jgi:phage-related protein